MAQSIGRSASGCPISGMKQTTRQGRREVRFLSRPTLQVGASRRCGAYFGGIITLLGMLP